MDHENKENPEAHGGEFDTFPEGAFRLPHPSAGLRSPSAGLRESVFERTEQVLIARVRRRFLAKLTLLAATYLGGIVTTFLVMDRPNQQPEEIAASVESPSHIGQIADSPGEMVQRAQSAPPAERARLLERAGDIYLTDRCDVEEALRCYRWALNAMPATKQTTVESDDSWLLAALKDSRR